MTRLTLLAALFVLPACDSPTAPAVAAAPSLPAPSADAVGNDRYEIPIAAFNECTGETIAGIATFHDVYALRTTPSGVFHVVAHDNLKFEGRSPTTEYVGSQEDNATETVAAGYTINEESHFTLVSKGSAPNVILQFSYHITVTPNGEVSSYRDNFSIKCTG